jgi:hypothetical protein
MELIVSASVSKKGWEVGPVILKISKFHKNDNWKTVITDQLFRLYVYLSLIYIYMRALDRASACTHMRKHERIRTWHAEPPVPTNALGKMKKKFWK